ncbi:hypothetical protein [Streptomyces albogriseolus]|uniref:hypothetical protein n=1 Tax=Streptomyces albogriseolus TaxID=1887 RepID=UPI003460FAB0
MTLDDAMAQLLSIFVSAVGLIVARLIARYLPEDPDPIPRRRRSRPDPDQPAADTAQAGDEH